MVRRTDFGQIKARKRFVALLFLRDMIRLEYGLNSNQHAYFLFNHYILTPVELVTVRSGRNWKEAGNKGE